MIVLYFHESARNMVTKESLNNVRSPLSAGKAMDINGVTQLVRKGNPFGPLAARDAAAAARRRRRKKLTSQPSWSWPSPRRGIDRPSTEPTYALAFALRGNGPAATSAKTRYASGGPLARARGPLSWRTSLKGESIRFETSTYCRNYCTRKNTF